MLRFSLNKALSTTGIALALTSSMACHAASLHQQRSWYVQANVAFNNGNDGRFDYLLPKLKTYSLYPYLQYRAFSQHLFSKTPEQVEHFLTQYKDLPFSPIVRQSYLAFLARNQQWGTYLEFQSTPPKKSQQGQCLYYTAKAGIGQTDQAWEGAKNLWLTGNSLPLSCNNLLQQWQQAGQLNDDLILKRMVLAFNANNPALMNYLSYKLSSEQRHLGKTVINLYNAPQYVGQFAKKNYVNPLNQSISMAAFNRLANENVLTATKVYNMVVNGQNLNNSQQQTLAADVLNLIMYTPDPKLMAWRDKMLNKSTNSALINQRFRLSIGDANWSNAMHWLNKLPKADHSSTRWKFWKGYLQYRLGDDAQSVKVLSSILGQSNYYSAAAATILNRPVRFSVTSAPLNRNKIRSFQPALNRIAQFYALEYAQGANNEWNYLMKHTTADQKVQLADYAQSKGWAYLSVMATIKGKLWNYASLRFPLAYEWLFNRYGKRRGIHPETMMALTRQESAFNPSAQSYVGAKGLMQLMPSTARYVSQQIGYPYRGANSLYNPSVNVCLGSAYLQMILGQYNNNRIFTFASYNAGPGRVNTWRKLTDGKLDAFSFIESIPFTQTRNYVENILMFELYYSKLMHHSLHLLTQSELSAKY